ncbi:MAG: serine/threonine-protein kinase [Caldimonas sp.]
MLTALRSQQHPLLVALERMLAARTRIAGSDFLESLPSLFVDAPIDGARHRTGERIGGHVLVSRLGAGGAAEVWLAERAEGTFRRAVALKLPFQQQWVGGRDTFLERFDRERDILASLDHPNIARLLDAGVADGQPWLSLEYVHGETITTWCDAHRLPIEARVRLFLQVLLAVEHAHARLAIHRDLKPGNILVAAPGVARLLDFGIAKLLDAQTGLGDVTELTVQGGRPMTPRYASPEQLRASTLTTAVDVYALGLVLHELLSGGLPYDLAGKSFSECESVILTVEPKPPSQLTPSVDALEARRCDLPAYRTLLRRDLDAIVLHCLHKSPDERYASVEGLRLDLQRWLDHEPVQVAVPSPWYRAAKFVRRHRRGVAISAIVAGVIAALVVATAWQAVISQRETTLALTAKEFVLDGLHDADPESSKDAGAAAGPLLDQSVARAERLLAKQPELHAEVLERIADVNQNLDRYGSAQAVLEQALTIRRRLGERGKTAHVQMELAFNAHRLGDNAHATEILAGLDTDQNPELRARGRELEGWLRWDRGDRLGAKAAWLVALALGDQAFGHNDARVAAILQGLVAADMSLRDYASAERHADDEVAVTGRAGNVTMTNRIAAAADRAEVSFAAGNYARSIPETRATLDACVNALGTRAEACFLMRRQLALMLLRINANGEAMKLLPALDEEAANTSSPARQIQAQSIALRVDAANAIAGSRNTELEALLKPSVMLTLRLEGYMALAEAAVRRADPATASHYLDVLSAQPEGVPSDYAARAAMIRGLAEYQQGRAGDALRTIEQATKAYAVEYGADHTQTVLCELNIVEPLLASGEAAQARQRIERAIALLRSRLPADAQLFTTLAKLKGKPVEVPVSGSTPTMFFN